MLSAIGIVVCKMNPQIPLTHKDMIFIAMFFAVGVGLCLGAFRTSAAAKKYLTDRVQGKCISYEFQSGQSRARRSIFEYTYRGSVYRNSESGYANKGYAKVGAIRELMISPENPRCIYDPVAGKARKIGGIKIGMIFIGITAIILIVSLNS